MGAEPADEGEVTRLLQEWSGGDTEALDRLMPVVFSHVRDLAARAFVREPSDHTLQPTALVSEVYLRLNGCRSVQWQNREQLFGFLADLMRRILVDHARRRRALKRGGAGARKVPVEQVNLPVAAPDVLPVHEALERLEAVDAGMARLVTLKHFLGLTNQETATVLQVSVKTVERQWRSARAWLRRELGKNSQEEGIDR